MTADDEFELWPENVEAIDIFMSIQTQWRVGPVGPTGLDYTGVASALRMMRIRSSPELFSQIRLMETTALALMTEAKT